MTKNHVLHVDKLTYGYQHKPILYNIDFALKQGQGLLVQGENGSGKSTLLKILSGLLLPDSGSINWQGQTIFENKSEFKKSMSFLGHKNGLKNDLTIIENLKFSLLLHGLNLSTNANEILGALGLQKKQQDLVSSLSFGQKRKTALARLILMQKPLWLLDEPFVGLDKNSANFIRQAISEHIESKGTVILTHHGELDLGIPIETLNLAVY